MRDYVYSCLFHVGSALYYLRLTVQAGHCIISSFDWGGGRGLTFFKYTVYKNGHSDEQINNKKMA